MPLHEKIHSGMCCDVEWPIRQCVVQDCGSPGPEQRRVRIGSGGEGSNGKYGTDLTQPQQSGWSTGSDWEKSDVRAVGDLRVQNHARSGKVRVSKMSGLENPSGAQTK